MPRPTCDIHLTVWFNLYLGLNPDIRVLCKKTLSVRINKRYVDVVERIKDTLRMQKSICTTADVWSNSRKSYMGVTAHWINETNLKRESAVLACRRFPGVHSFDNVATLLDSIHRSYNISSKKVLATVTDNGSNFVKAFKEFGIKSSKILIFNSVAVDEELEEEEDLQLMTLEGPVNDEQSFTLPNHKRCASHTLSLVVTTDLSKAIAATSAISKIHHTAMGKCTALWNSSSRPKSAEIIQEKIGKTLRVPCATRWNSLYDGLSQLMEVFQEKHREDLSDLLIKLNLPQFKDTEESYLKAYCDILKPIAVCLDRLQGQKTIYYAELIPSLFKAKSNLEQIQTDTTSKPHCRSLVKSVLESLKSRFEHYFSLDEEVNDAIVATCSHPFFKMRWIPANFEANEKVRIRNLLFQATKFLRDTNSTVVIRNLEEDDHYNYDDQPTSESQDTNTELQVVAYLDDANTSLEMLENHTLMKNVFLHYNVVLPSSAPVERLFSYAGMIARPKRRKLSDELFEKLVVLKGNM